MKFYDLADWPSPEERHNLNFSHNKTNGPEPERIEAISLGEFRQPKAGEWFLSGAIPEAYKARRNLTTKYEIVRLCLTRETTTKQIIKL